MIGNRYNFSAGGELLKTFKDCYCVEFIYENEKNAKDFFAKVSDFLLCLDKCNNTLLAPFGAEIDLQTEIEQLEFGSLRSWLKDTLEKINDEQLKHYCNNPKEAIIDLLIALKHKALEFLSSGDEEKFLQNYKNEIEKSNLKNYGYTINKSKLLKDLSDLSKSSVAFHNPPLIKLNEKEYIIKQEYSYKNSEGFKQTSTTRGIFTIKKPDLAGSSQWEIIGDRVLKVKIDDKNFLQKLKNREILIGFGERIEATLITNTLIDKDNLGILENEVSLENEYILKEINILSRQASQQKQLLT